MNDFNSLHQALYKLYEFIFHKVTKLKDGGFLIKTSYETIEAKEITYSTKSFIYDWENITRFYHYEWVSELFQNFESEVKNSSELIDSQKELYKTLQVPETTNAATRIFLYVRILMQEIPNGRIHEGNINKYIDTFINDLYVEKDDKKLLFHIQLWIDNLWLEEDIPISNNVVIRKPTKKDIAFTRPAGPISDFDRMTGKGLIGSAIIEIDMEAHRGPRIGLYSKEIAEEIESWVDIFRLFKLGNITISYQSVVPKSLIQHPINENFDPPFDKSWTDKIDYQDISNYEYFISKEEIPYLILFIDKIKPILKNISRKSYLSGNHYDLAFHRYKDALLRSEVNVNRIVSAISALESLLSSSTDNISYRISIYLAGILRFFNFSTTDVFEKMRAAYDIRSTFAHGSKLKDKQISFARNHTHEIVNYTRICLLFFLQLKDKLGETNFDKSKQEFIKKIDYSLIDTKSYEALEGLVRSDVYIPITNQFT